MFTIKKIEKQKDLHAFIDFPHLLYQNDPYYVPELFIAQKDLFTKHPFHQHSNLQCFLAINDNGNVVGRIAAILNNSYNAFHQSNDGFFGFFDCIDKQEIATALLDTAANWLRGMGLLKMMGPMNFSMHETCGVLVEGFEDAPCVMMTYNAFYYNSLIEQSGFSKKMDLYAYRWNGLQYNKRPLRLVDSLLMRLERNNITIRKIDMKRFTTESKQLHQVYNQVLSNNFGFSPMDEAEWAYLSKDLKMLVDPEFCLLAVEGDKIVGFALAIPDMNQVFRKIKRGRLLPWGIFKLLWGKRKVNGIRIIILGVIDGYRKRGIETCLYGRIIDTYIKRGMSYAEASWTLETNHLINSAIESVGGHRYKTYRIYEKVL